MKKIFLSKNIHGKTVGYKNKINCDNKQKLLYILYVNKIKNLIKILICDRIKKDFNFRREDLEANKVKIKYMKEALKEAKKAYDKEEIPVGAIIVKDNKIIARAHNIKEEKNDTTKHAEIIAIQKASKKLDSWRLIDCEMYVTLEPCSMCAGALIQSRLKKVYIGTMDTKTGACGSVLNLLEDYPFNHKVEIEKGIMQKECETILKEFFKILRDKK